MTTVVFIKTTRGMCGMDVNRFNNPYDSYGLLKPGRYVFDSFDETEPSKPFVLALTVVSVKMSGDGSVIIIDYTIKFNAGRNDSYFGDGHIVFNNRQVAEHTH